MNPLAKLVAAFPVPEIHPTTIRVYAEMLQDQKPEHLAWACDEAIRTSKHLPRVSDLLELIRRRKIDVRKAEDAEDRRRQLGSPVNQDPPKLGELLKLELAKKNGATL